MKTKTAELTGMALDWVVAKCEGHGIGVLDDPWFMPSTKWAQGGPLIEREGITIQQSPERDCWMAHKDGPAYEGPTPLIAAMRCYVASKLGDEIEVPDDVATR